MRESDSKYIKNTYALTSQAIQEVDQYPCLWLRGILPANLIKIDHDFDPSHVEQLVFESPPRSRWNAWPPGVYGTDGAGGVHGKTPQLRRCGCGVVRVVEKANTFVKRMGVFCFCLALCKQFRGRNFVPSSWLLNMSRMDECRFIRLRHQCQYFCCGQAQSPPLYQL